MIREHLGVLVWVVKGRWYVLVYLCKDVYIMVGLHLAWFGNIRLFVGFHGKVMVVEGLVQERLCVVFVYFGKVGLDIMACVCL